MESVIQGRVYKFGDNVNSDIIIPGRYLIYIDRERLAQHAFEMLGEGFSAKLRGFDILVAGRNFGCGSKRPRPFRDWALKPSWLARLLVRSIAMRLMTACPSLNVPRFMPPSRKAT